MAILCVFLLTEAGRKSTASLQINLQNVNLLELGVEDAGDLHASPLESVHQIGPVQAETRPFRRTSTR